MDSDLPDREEIACALEVMESRLARQGQYDQAVDVFTAAKLLRLADDEIARLTAERDEWKARAERAERAERDKNELLEVRQSLHAAMMLEWRDVEHGCECLACGGAGVKSYPSTSTWRGGIGGQAFTTDVCDKCWGSGDRNNAWPSHRALVEACEGGRDGKADS